MNAPTSRLTWIAIAIAALVVAAVSATVAGLWSAIGNAEISVAGWIAMGLGVLFAFALGVGLMSLVFFSSRAGYDDPDGDSR